jgi:hypothetical protein
MSKTEDDQDSEGGAKPKKPKELTAPQHRAILAILSSRNVEDAAKLCDLSRATLYRWCNDPVFRAALTEAEGQAIDYAARRLILLQGSAIDTLQAVIEDADAPKSIRVRAALGALDVMIRIRELRNVEVRLIALEQVYRAKELAGLVHGDEG